MSKQIETDWQTFIKFWLVPLIIAGLLFFMYKAVTGLVIIGASIFLALALKPLVEKVNSFFTKHFGSDKKHRTVSVVFAYLIVVAVIGAALAIIGPVVVNETKKFVENFPETFETRLGGWDGVNSFGESIGIPDLHTKLSDTLSSFSNNVFGILKTNLFSGISSVADIVMMVALTLVLTLLMLLEGPDLMDVLWRNLGAGSNKKSISVAQRTVGRMANVVSTYVSRQALVAMIDGCASMLIVFILSLIFHFSSSLAIPMGLTTMLFYLIPMFGQFIGGALVTMVLLFSSPIAALVFAIIYIIYSQIENNVIAPKIQGDALNLQPVVILCAIVIGMYMFGLPGAIVAIPIAGCIRVLVDEYPNIKTARE